MALPYVWQCHTISFVQSVLETSIFTRCADALLTRGLT
jgi:hypothetical protein